MCRNVRCRSPPRHQNNNNNNKKKFHNTVFATCSIALDRLQETDNHIALGNMRPPINHSRRDASSTDANHEKPDSDLTSSQEATKTLSYGAETALEVREERKRSEPLLTSTKRGASGPGLYSHYIPLSFFVFFSFFLSRHLVVLFLFLSFLPKAAGKGGETILASLLYSTITNYPLH